MKWQLVTDMHGEDISEINSLHVTGCRRCLGAVGSEEEHPVGGADGEREAGGNVEQSGVAVVGTRHLPRDLEGQDQHDG